MTDEEYKKEYSQLRQEFEEYEVAWKKRKRELINRCARENARFEVGDIISSNNMIIRVGVIFGEEISYNQKVYTVYRGDVLTKKLEPKKSGAISTIYDDGREITKIEKEMNNEVSATPFAKTKYKTLPETIEDETGKSYHLFSGKCTDEIMKGWWFFEYRFDDKSLPPQVTDGKDCYYLCSVFQTKEEAEQDMLERINAMTKFMEENK